MQKVNLPQQALEIMQRLFEHHYKAYVVGTAVRELLTGGTPLDYDIITDCSIERLNAIFSADYRILEQNIAAGEIIVMVRGMAIMVAPFRICDKDGSLIYSNNVLDDLLCRDFTVNAICAASDGDLFDPLEGAKCLLSKPYTLTAVESRLADDEKSILSVERDPSILLTALALASEGDYSIDKKTADCIMKSAQSVSTLDKSTLKELFERVLMGRRAREILLEYRTVFFVVFPELALTDGYNNQYGEHSMPLYEHICKSISFSPPILELRYALLFHGTGKPDCEAQKKDGKLTFYGHAQRASVYTERAMKRLDISEDLIREVCFLVENHDVFDGSENKETLQLKEMFGEKGLKNLLLLGSANLRAKNPDFEAKAYELKKLSEQLQR